ncbi:MAG: YafY family transcriptional regulator [Gammaproteobacteria bacterium]|nr:YafY family transcriptional regulator [Gammaproteobacteria bacterium]
MKKFDRVTSILIHLQTHRVVRAQDLAAMFDVTERTIYRDMRTLENAGVPIGSEAGVGYFLDKGYNLPPVMFNRDEAAALLIGGKVIENQVDQSTWAEFQQAINKVRSVLDSDDRHYLDVIDDGIAVHASKDQRLSARADTWLRECRSALSTMQVVALQYGGGPGQSPTERQIEPVGLYYYSHHWHLIAWCRLREDYRDFRLDRIRHLELLPETFRRRDYRNLGEYLNRDQSDGAVHEIRLLFTRSAARFVGEQRYYFGFVEESTTEDGIQMVFLVRQLDWFGRWLLQFSNGVRWLEGDSLLPVMSGLVHDLEIWRNRIHS